MCGIAGETNLKQGVHFDDYHNDMLRSLARRGPDDHGVYKTESYFELKDRQNNKGFRTKRRTYIFSWKRNIFPLAIIKMVLSFFA